MCGLAALVLVCACGGPGYRTPPSEPGDGVRDAPVPAPVPEEAPAAADAAGVPDTADVGQTDPDSPRTPPAPDEAWREDAGRGIVAPLRLDGDLLIATTTNGKIDAISADDGSGRWSGIARDARAGSGAGVATIAGDGVYFATEMPQARLAAFAREDGGLLWERFVGSIRFAPLVVDGSVFVATDRGTVVALDAETGEEIWFRTLDAAAAAAPVARGGELFVPTDADVLYRLSRANGTVTGRTPLPASVSAPVTRVGETLVIPFYTGDVLALDLPSMEERWRAELGWPVLAAPAAAPDGSVYLLTTAAEVWRARPGSGEVERIAALGGAARSSLALDGGRVLVGRLDGTFFALRRDGSVVWKKTFDESIAAAAAAGDGAIYVPLLRGDIVKLR